MNTASTKQRIIAYMIDIIIVSIISSIITLGIPRSRLYNETKKDTERILGEYIDNKMNMNEATDSFFENQYILSKENVPVAIIELTLTIGYFVLFAYYNKGQTIGKKYAHIRVVTIEGEDVNYSQLFGRTLIINGCLLSIISLALIGIINSNQYANTIGLMGLVQSILTLCAIVMVARRSDKRGLHDILFKTKVIEC